MTHTWSCAQPAPLGWQIPGSGLCTVRRSPSHPRPPPLPRASPQERVYFVKPSERRKQEASLASKRFKQQEFKCAGWHGAVQGSLQLLACMQLR